MALSAFSGMIAGSQPSSTPASSPVLRRTMLSLTWKLLHIWQLSSIDERVWQGMTGVFSSQQLGNLIWPGTIWMQYYIGPINNYTTSGVAAKGLGDVTNRSVLCNHRSQ